MTHVTDLLSSFYEALSKNFCPAGQPAGQNDTYLQLGWPGISLSDADFKAADNPAGPYDSSAAEETLSMLANIAPVCSAVRFENSGYEIDDLYQILITGAVPQGADPASLMANPAYKLFSDAQYEFSQSQHGSNRDPGLFFYPSRATPTDWYTEAAAQSWPTFSLSTGQIRPATPTSPFVRFGGKQLVDPGILKLAPQNRDAAQIKLQLQRSISSRVSRFEALKPAVSGCVVRPLDATRARVMSPAVSPRLPRTPSTLEGDLAHRIAVANADPALKKNLRPSFAVSRLAKLDGVNIDPVKFDIVANRSIPLSSRILLRKLLSEQLATAPLAEATEGFSLSFRYCMVNITRSWLKSALLNTKTWYMFGTPAGEYSQGRLDNNPGMFPMLPVSFLAIRDLKISARWSQQDRQNLTQAKSFGPFDIGARTINQDTIEAKGLQIIAWMSRLTPVLPPLPAPAG